MFGRSLQCNLAPTDPERRETRVAQTMSLANIKDSPLPSIPAEHTSLSSSPTSFYQGGDHDDYQLPPRRSSRSRAASPASSLRANGGNGVHYADYSNRRRSRDRPREEQFIQQPQPQQRPPSQQGMLIMNQNMSNGEHSYYEPPRRPGSQGSNRPYPPQAPPPPNQYYDQQSMRRGSPQFYPPSTTIDPRPPSTDPDPFYANAYAQGMQGPMHRGNPSPSINNVPLPRPPSPPMLDQSHLHPGVKASLLSHEQTLALYRSNAKKTSDPDLIFEFAVFMLEASKSLAIPPADPNNSNQLEIERAQQKQEGQVKEALALLKRIADRGHVLAQYTLADCNANGIGTVRGKQDFDRAFPLFILAAKHGHVDACYRAGTCCENGWGCRRDSAKAVQFFRKAGAAQHPGAMYRLGLAELNGELGLSKNTKEGVKWLKRSAEHATAEFPHALHELALCHEKGIDNVVFVDYDYAAELFGQAAELGYAPSAYRLGECYEYGRMGCPQDPALSIHYYVRHARSTRNESLTNKRSRAEHCRSAKSSRCVFRINCLVPRWLAWCSPAVRHGGLPMG
jgi:TPR repeat protein